MLHYPDSKSFPVRPRVEVNEQGREIREIEEMLQLRNRTEATPKVIRETRGSSPKRKKEKSEFN